MGLPFLEFVRDNLPPHLYLLFWNCNLYHCQLDITYPLRLDKHVNAVNQKILTQYCVGVCCSSVSDIIDIYFRKTNHTLGFYQFLKSIGENPEIMREKFILKFGRDLWTRQKGY